MLPRANSFVSDERSQTGLQSIFSQRSEAAALVSIVAHPGDEVIAAGGCFEEWRNAVFVHITDGTPRHLDRALDAGYDCRDEYARARRREFESAVRCAGIHEPRIQNLGYDDGDICWSLAPVTMSIASLLHESGAQMVVTHAYEGENPDRDGVAFAVQAACALLAKDGITPPLRIEAAGSSIRDGSLKIGKFLVPASGESVVVRLDPDHLNLKRAMLDCLETQRPGLEGADLHAESFRLAPDYDFTKPPRGRAWEYDRHGFEVNGRRWARLAAEASRVLGLGDQA